MEPKRKKILRGVLITVGILLALLLVAFAGAGAYANYLMSQIPRMEDVSFLSPSEVGDLLQTDPDLEPIDPSVSLPDISDVTFPTEPVKPPQKSKNVINILLIGQDETVPGVRARSDSMILVTFNTATKAVTFTSFMRDAYVQIPGYSPNKLNHAYQYGGVELLNKTLEVNYGVEVDGNIEVNFEQFKAVIDMLGGVEVELTEKESWYMGHVPGCEVPAGKVKLNGEQALLYARIREIDSDYNRTARQRNVLMGLAKAYKDRPVTEMFALLDDMMGMVTTNMTNAQMTEYGLRVIPVLAGSSFNTLQIPANGTFDQGNAQVRPGLKAWFQYNIDFEKNREILRRIFEE